MIRSPARYRWTTASADFFLVVEFLAPSLLPELQDLISVSESEHARPSGAAANTDVDTFAQSLNQLPPEMIDLVHVYPD